MTPKSIPKQAWKSIEELNGWFQVLWRQFMLLSVCIHFRHFLAFACIFLAFCIHFLSVSSHVHACHFAFISFSFLLPFICMHLPVILHSFPFSFLFPFICMHFPFMLHSCPYILQSICIRFLSFPFKRYRNGFMAGLGGRV